MQWNSLYLFIYIYIDIKIEGRSKLILIIITDSKWVVVYVEFGEHQSAKYIKEVQPSVILK